MSAAELVEDHAGDLAVVYGTPPPQGRDLDVLVRDRTADRLRSALIEHGYDRSGRTWARFADGDVEVVDLTPASSWGLSPTAEEELFARAQLLPGHAVLARPAAAHQVLIEARRLARSGVLSEKARGRVQHALDEDPAARGEAERMAPEWGVDLALACLWDVLAGRSVPPARLRDAGRQVDRVRGRGSGPAARLGRLVPARRHGRLVALSGLDGSGKSGQAKRLAAGLDTLGYDCVVVWTRLGSGARLRRLGDPVKRFVGKLVRTERTTPATSRYAESFGPPDPIRSSREGSRVVTFLWALVVALDHVVEQRRGVRAHLRAGRVVVCDRWTLDSLAHLRYRYGASAPLALHEWLLRTLAPRPHAAFFLDVPGDVAHRRKPDQYSAEQLQRQAGLYARAAQALGVTVVNGTLPPADIADRIGPEAWRAVRTISRWPFVRRRP